MGAMDHAQGAEAELAAVAARAEVLRAGIGARRGRALRLAALAVLGEADDVFHQWWVLRNLILFMCPRSEAAYTHLKPEKIDKL
jgi:hypothetical protein